MNESKEQQVREPILKIFTRLAFALIAHESDLEVSAVVTNGRMIEIETRAHAEDHGKIIGSEGKTFKAFVTVLGLAGLRHGVVVRLKKLQQPIVGEREFQTPFRAAEDWNRDKVERLLNQTLEAVVKHPAKVRAVESEADTTRFFVEIDSREKLPVTIGELTKSLSIIFHAIGKAHGRYIYVCDERDDAAIMSAGSRVAPNPKRF